MAKIRCTNHVKNNKYYVGEGKEYPTYKREKANWVDHIFCINCLLKHVTEGKIEGKIEVT